MASTSYNPNNPCGQSFNGVFDVSGIDFGQTQQCVSGGHMTDMSIQMQAGTGSFWDLGAGDSGTNNYKAVITHEWGHGAGFGVIYQYYHFPVATESTGICWDDSTLHTMCNGQDPAPAKYSTLEEHDEETFANAY